MEFQYTYEIVLVVVKVRNQLEFAVNSILDLRVDKIENGYIQIGAMCCLKIDQHHTVRKCADYLMTFSPVSTPKDNANQLLHESL